MADLWTQLSQTKAPKFLTTAEILYYFPDYPDLLQQYIWQDYDIAPEYPTLNHFLSFWRENIEGRLHSVRVTNVNRIISETIIIKPAEFLH